LKALYNPNNNITITITSLLKALVLLPWHASIPPLHVKMGATSPYRLTPTGGNRQGDVSALYRHIVWQQDSFSGTDRLGLLGGAIVPTVSNRDAAVQAGFVFTHFKNRHEIDVDGLYQSGQGSRADSGRYDLSWQYRLSPSDRLDWGISQELNSVLELNGRWNEGNNITHQLTLGLQWIHPKLVIEGGVTKDLNNTNEVRYILSTRFHF